MSCSHALIYLRQTTWMVNLWHAFDTLSPTNWTFPWRRLVAVVVVVVVALSLVDIGNARHLHTILGRLLIQILERILVKVYGCRAVILWSSLLKSTATHLVMHTFEAHSNLLSR